MRYLAKRLSQAQVTFDQLAARFHPRQVGLMIRESDLGRARRRLAGAAVSVACTLGGHKHDQKTNRGEKVEGFRVVSVAFLGF